MKILIFILVCVLGMTGCEKKEETIEKAVDNFY